MATPRWSVVIAAYRSERGIGPCLDALRAQTVRDFEVIVVNSSPGDRTGEIVRSRFPEVRFIEHPTRLLPHAARNRGVLEASGRSLVFTDADCRAQPDWLERLGEAQEAGHALVCGSIELDGSGYFARGVHLCKYSFRLPQLPAGPCRIAGTANACYSRRAWDAVGPFQGDRFAGDAILSIRAAKAGVAPWFAPHAVVRHRYEGGLVTLLGERIERGRDFADARMELEDWSRWRAIAHVLAFPLLPLAPLLRAGRDASSSGWIPSYLATLPLQWAGHFAWSLGEFTRHLRRGLGRGESPGAP